VEGPAHQSYVGYAVYWPILTKQARWQQNADKTDRPQHRNRIFVLLYWRS